VSAGGDGSRPATRYVALLRAVNVGGSGKLSMSALRTMCVEAGFDEVETLLASGNVVFSSPASAARVKAALEEKLSAEAGLVHSVVIRTGAQMRDVLEANPFQAKPADRTIAIFLDGPPPPDALDHVTGLGLEEMRLGEREIYVFYAAGIGRSKLRIPAAKAGTARNMSTIAKLAGLASRGAPEADAVSPVRRRTNARRAAPYKS
jgi:uncharacterized protein (DUF1697 family)